MMERMEIDGLDGLSAAAQKFIILTKGKKVFAFEGEMGVGKTTFIKEVCALLGVGENITSPTFALVNEYQIADGSIYHFDCYRLKSIAEAYDIGAEEYFYSGNYCFVEWPQIIASLLPIETVWVKIEALENGKRVINIGHSI